MEVVGFEVEIDGSNEHHCGEGITSLDDSSMMHGEYIPTHVCVTPPRGNVTTFESPNVSLGTQRSEDPLTPTANLKMLTTVATHLQGNRTRKELFSHSTSKSAKVDGRNSSSHIPLQKLPVDLNQVNSRESRSLQILCTRFLDLFPEPTDGSKCVIVLDEVALKLEAERRRLYDIVNILEILDMAQKRSKNTYFWNGRQALIQRLAALRKIALQEKNHSNKDNPSHSLQKKESTTRFIIKNNNFTTTISPELREDTEVENDENMKDALEKPEKSLRKISLKFIKLFLTATESEVISMPEIVDAVVQNSINSQKTNFRRLYDIANILVALKLIEKVKMQKKYRNLSGFQYVGPTFAKLDAINEDVSHSFLTRPIIPGVKNSAEILPKRKVNYSGEQKEPSKKSLKMSRSKSAVFSSLDLICKATEKEYQKLCSNSDSKKVPVETQSAKFSKNCPVKLQRFYSDSCLPSPGTVMKCQIVYNKQPEALGSNEQVGAKLVRLVKSSGVHTAAAPMKKLILTPLHNRTHNTLYHIPALPDKGSVPNAPTVTNAPNSKFPKVMRIIDGAQLLKSNLSSQSVASNSTSMSTPNTPKTTLQSSIQNPGNCIQLEQ